MADRPAAHRPISIGPLRRKAPAKEHPMRVAWALLLVVGFPFALMAVLTTLARAGIYVPIFSPLYQPWPPDVLKPFLGYGVFAATLAYLAYCAGHRSGFRSGLGVGISATRSWIEAHAPRREEAIPPSTAVLQENPPPPPAPASDPTAPAEPAPPPAEPADEKATESEPSAAS